MNLDIKLPVCPVCKEIVATYVNIPAERDFNTLRQQVTFRCDSVFQRECKPDFRDLGLPYGCWSTWKCAAQCSKATEIALKLLEKTNEEA